MTVSGSQSSRWDQLFEEIIAGRAFLGGGDVTAGAGVVPVVQLFNPAASVVDLHIVNAWAQHSGVGPASFHDDITMATTLVGTSINMLTGGPTPVGELRTMTIPLVGGNPIHTFWHPNTQAQSPCFVTWGPTITPGRSFTFQSDVVATRMTARFIWIEAPR